MEGQKRKTEAHVRRGKMRLGDLDRSKDETSKSACEILNQCAIMSVVRSKEGSGMEK